MLSPTSPLLRQSIVVTVYCNYTVKEQFHEIFHPHFLNNKLNPGPRMNRIKHFGELFS